MNEEAKTQAIELLRKHLELSDQELTELLHQTQSQIEPKYIAAFDKLHESGLVVLILGRREKWQRDSFWGHCGSEGHP